MSERVQLATGSEGRPVAHKCALDAADRQRLAAEAELLRAAHHPGVVHLVADDAEADGRLVLGWCSGRSLATTAVRSVDEVVRLMSTLATTVADLHQVGITHGAIDASHVLLDGRGRPVLCSFSSAAQHPSIVDPAHRARVDADAVALGQLLQHLIAQAVPAPARRWVACRRHRQLLRLAELAADAPPERRLSPRALAAALADLAPPPERTPRLVEATRRGAPDRPTPAGAGDLAPAGPAGSPGPSRDPGPPTSTRPADPRALLVELDRLRPADDPPETTSVRRPTALVVAGLGAVAVALLGGLVLARPGSTSTSSATPTPGDAEHERATTDEVLTEPPTRAPVAPSSTPRAAPAPTTAPGADAGPRPCPRREGGEQTSLEPVVAHADVDGDGCAEAVVVDGNVVAAGDRRWRIGEPGDRVVVGDWDCDGTASPAVLRATTGDVHVFPGWASPGDRLAGTVVARSTGGRTLRATAEPCPALVVVGAAGDTTTVAVTDRAPAGEDPS